MLRDYDAAFDDLGWTPPTEAPKLPGEQEEQDSLGQDAARDGSSNVILDAFRGLGNGVFNAVDNTVGITGIDLGLEDVFGETQTMVGGLVEGFTQFATGFVPVFGALGRVGALSGVGRGLAAGVVADFTVFDAQEERLSNLLVEVPALKNPVTEWLAADEDDGQLEGRLKNVIEGASIGLAFDGFMLALRQLKAGRKAIAEGASPEEAAERVREVEKVEAERVKDRPADPYTQSVADSLHVDGRRAEALVALQDAMGIERDSVQWVRGGEAAEDALDQTAFHGSAYKFDKFSTRHIGRGEGNQAFGWGLYFAESKQVAEHYKETVARLRSMNRERVKVRWDGIGEVVSDISQRGRSIETAQDLPLSVANKLLEKIVRFQLEPDKAVEAALKDARWYVRDLRKRRDFSGAPWGREGELYDEEVRLLEVLQKNPQRITVEGRTEGKYGYKVELAPKDDELFDLDELVDDQSPAVLKKLEATDWWENALQSLEDRAAMGGFNPTGLDLIRHLEEEMDPKEVSMLLVDAGIKGNKYLDGSSRGGRKGGSYNYVIFDGADVEITGLFQGGRRRPKGSVEFTHDADAVIRGFTASDFSTGVHELAHIARRQFINMDVDAKARLGIEDADIKVAEEWAGAVDGKWTVEAEEKFAQGFERYISEGKAPNSQLESLFASMRDFMLNVYRKIRGDEVGIEVSPQMREVFDKLVDAPEGRASRAGQGGGNGRLFQEGTDDFSDFILPEIDPEQVRQFVTDTDNRLLLNAVPGIDLNLGVHPRSGDKRTRELLGLDPDYYSTVEAAGDYGAEAVSFQIREQIMPQIRETVAADKAYVQGNIEEIQKRMLDTGSRYAKAIGEADAEKALKEMAELNKLSLEAPEQMLEAEVAMQTAMFTMKTIEKDTARHIERLRPKIVDGSATDLELQLFGEVVSVNKQVREAVVRGKSSTGRTFQAYKEQASFIGGMEGEAVAQAQIKALAERGGREEQLTQARALLALVDEQGPEALMEHLAKTEGRPWLNLTLEYWMNSILSGLKTMTVDFMGNAATSLYLPFEGMVGAGARGQWDQVKVYAETYLDLLSSTRDAWNYSKKAFGTFMEEGENVLLPDSRAFAEGEARKAISSDAFGLRAESPMGRFLDSVGPKVRIPGRILQATDEFFKQLNARAIVKRNLRKEALDKGLQGKQLAEYVEGGVDKIIRDGEMFKAQDIYKKAKANVEAQQPKTRDIFDSTTEEDIKDAIKEEFNRLWQSEGKFNQSVAEAATAYAEDVTFTKSLRPGSYAKGAQDFLVSHPEMRFVVPFVRTPVNILGFAFDRSPIAAANAAKDLILSKTIGKEFPAMSEAQRHLARDLGSSDPAIRSEATGRMIMATGSFFTILSAVSAGTITGRGPNSKEERRALEAAGWQPYSIRIGDTYVSYNRMDPFATMIGTIVDYREYGRWADTGDQTILEQQMLAVISSLAQNFTNKSYVSGIRSFVDLLTDPESNAATEAGRLGASFIPSLVGQNVGAVDPYAREMRTMSDSFRNRIPFLSDNLDPVRNILGEPVDRVRSLGGETIPLANAFLPIASRSTKDRAIATELASLAWPFSPPPKKKQGQDLTQIALSSGHSAYDRWQELTGQVRIGRSTLKSSLKRLIASERYQRLPAESEPGNPSPRVELIRSEIRRFRNRAWRDLLKEVPELRQATNQFERGRELRRRGVSVPLGL